jgi:nucleotide-binding universal stress UspA family protein
VAGANGTTVIPIRRIVVGLDGSAAAEAATAAAITMARQFDAEVIGVHATGLLDVWEASEADSTRDAHEGVIQQLRGPWSESLRASGVPMRLEQRDGPPADTLLAIAEAVGADLIVVGSRGVGDTPLGELGSTSGKIVRRSTRPVLVVPDQHG